ncbi:nitrogen fixation protein NifQ [Methylovulum psychrotolerans]|jgi:nitrogen fixation protein NifQ|uniref:Nitrogen fixation protein NifQ n=1 Tax=Methylovulum psychrotolerans TaxID=1704499 RepID=A0A1Z4C107_9GAMM|nr:nitrogen fixation protein NifQ [Methylovulum psychrotolerans]ASF47216.1 nitrogen fixation protein NifQ [Methylovulum psychrotolerans]MBT9099681.1 nitrogen fixation protein NifQ [Methylovulum psychrotolerans]POZ50464.1 nitrogen fixation protein NifQ [Methylovulum psychrotolerans]
MSALPQRRAEDPVFGVYQDLTTRPLPTPNGEWLAYMLASWWQGKGALPDYFGLSAGQFKHLKQHYFPDAALPEQAPSGIPVDFSRMLEKDDLVGLLAHYAVAEDSGIITDIIVAACLGSDHLWQDMGLWNRAQLSALLQYNFPDLAAKNTKDMKWKKFLYKQLCESEGLYLCRVPSCDLCIDYSKCYGNEN